MKQVPERLGNLLGIDVESIEPRRADSSGADCVVSGGGKTFMVEFNASSSAAAVSREAKKAVSRPKGSQRRVIPVVAVPFMSEVGRRICEEAGVGWFDLSGNARIVAPGLRVIIDGRPNCFRPVGRPSNVFAPKSARVARWLLIHPDKSFTQREIARGTGMTEGFVSRIVGRLEREGYVVRDDRGAVRPTDPGLMLDAWSEAYRFSQHALRQGHVAARSGDALLEFVRDVLVEQRAVYAATGLAAAWIYTRFAAFRTTTIYMVEEPDTGLLDRLGFREDPRGANLWLVNPSDAGVFQGATERKGVRCVHPVQAYLDLQHHSERAPEAAEKLHAERLAPLWKRDG